MTFDYSKLRGKIREKLGTQDVLADKLGLSHASLSAKLNGKVEFRQSEIERTCTFLEIKPEQIHDYFFTEKF